MKRNLMVSAGILSGFVFLITFLIGVGVSSETVWKEIVPFLGLISLGIIMLSGKSCCRSRRKC